jgi:hypothetical protein
MNRRNFFKSLAKAAAGFAILPSAVTYARTWKRTSDLWIPNPEWKNAPYESSWLSLIPRGKFPVGAVGAGLTARVLRWSSEGDPLPVLDL